ncbi:probable phospholipid-transporting ATPase IIB [Lynx canadensis]|uniref:probable phospholipid-transporting ATPase IIB n=1 Tax=Lynx canadensis TaxID=61383 RepID=UPI0011B01834|nr:probable phospholipid-transporting ATPase IIB [Lynx canadensis]
MADQIPLYPVRSAAAAAHRKRAAYYSAAGPGSGAEWPSSRYQLEDESAHLDEMPLMMSEEGFENDESDYHTLPRARTARRRRGLERFVCGGWKLLCTSCCDWLVNICQRKRELKARTVWLGCPEKCEEKHPRNSIKNQKYNIFTFIPGVLYEQFKFFLNLYFLVVSCSQFVPALKIGYLYTYWAPLGFVLAVTIMREAIDEFRRFQRDKEVNSQLYSKLTVRGKVQVKSSDIQVGDLIIVEKNQRIPSDMVFLRTSEKAGSCFIRTDQLDGETDWKLKVAVSCTQRLPALGDLFSISAYVYAQKPQLDIHSFEGTFTREDSDPPIHESLSIENTLWANTIVASGTVIGVVIYTGKETRSVMNTSNPKNKVGLLDLELNQLTKALFVALVALSVVMVTLQGFVGPWYRSLFRFLLLFSYIIPISLRVNLDMGKAAYGWMIMKDESIPGTVVRTSTIPEELGRLVYLLTDKTGTEPASSPPVGFRYATIYTMFPVFSLVLDQDVKPETAMLYPELYKDLTKGRSLSFKTFLVWVLISIYQGGILMYGALLLFESEFVHVLAISFTALILTELLMVALTIRTWHWLMAVAEVLSLGCYVASLAFLNEYFDVAFITTVTFVWKVSAITMVSCLPLYVLKYLKRKLSPPSYTKLTS